MSDAAAANRHGQLRKGSASRLAWRSGACLTTRAGTDMRVVQTALGAVHATLAATGT